MDGYTALQRAALLAQAKQLQAEYARLRADIKRSAALAGQYLAALQQLLQRTDAILGRAEIERAE